MTEVVHEAGLVRDFAIIMVVAATALVLFRRLGLPPILGYLLAGVLIGPYTFAWPSIGDIDTIRLLADLGLVLILFSLGLEFGWERIRRLGIIILFIGAFEIGVMISLGYGLGLLFGWNGTEAIFLGATMAISSSAILIKVLEGAGQLHGRRGRLIVGLLIVEDFAAVLLLAVLSGVATTGAGTISDVGLLVGKLALFSIAALVFGAIIAPRLIDLVADFGSREILLIASLGMMFGLALLGVELGVSAAAGAFLIGTVLGDTRHANRIGVAINPIRDMFAAIFFVSIGMLVDLRDVADFIGPAAAVAAVFIVGKVVANSAGGLFAGYRGREALAVGTGTPQIGEFSLAIANVGVAQGVVGAALFPVVTIATAFTAVAYPFIFKSSEKTADVLRRYAPAWVRALVNSVQVFGEGVRPRRTAGVPREEVRGPLRNLGLNVAIIIVLVTVGAFVLHSIEGAVETSFFGERIGRGMVGLIAGAAVMVFSVPSVLAIWRSLQSLSVAVATRVLPPGSGPTERMLAAAGSGVSVLVIVFLALWMLPFFFELFKLGGLAIVIPIFVIAAAAGMTTGLAFKAHRLLEASFGRTFFGEGVEPAEAVPHEAAVDTEERPSP